ncbi:MAG: hypothetical protein ABSB35_41885 [Bryobacteraceae bacterium]|jgi:glucose/arabinose dehydrogenase
MSGATTATGMSGANNSIGTWKLNVAKSKSTITNPVKSQTDVREATPDGGIKITRTEQLTDGTAVTFSFTFKYDGKEYPVTGAAFDFISAKRIDANTTTFEARKSGGKFHVTGQTVISKDGKTMTQTAKGTDAEGEPATAKNVFDKQ